MKRPKQWESESPITAIIPGFRSSAAAGCAWWRSKRFPSCSPPAQRRSPKGWSSAPKRRKRCGTGDPFWNFFFPIILWIARSAIRPANASSRTTTWSTGFTIRASTKTRPSERKPTRSGPHVILDQERCILCTRCVRFTREISKTSELGVIDRGHRSEIDVFPGFELNNPYSGNVVDICPVGALTDRDFRFKCRVWFLGSAPSICPGCSRGCNIEIHFNERFNPRYHDQRVHRLKPRYNEAVNGHWICDEGRYSYHCHRCAEPRLKTPQLKQGDGYREASWPRGDSGGRGIAEAGSGNARPAGSCPAGFAPDDQ